MEDTILWFFKHALDEKQKRNHKASHHFSEFSVYFARDSKVRLKIKNYSSEICGSMIYSINSADLDYIDVSASIDDRIDCPVTGSEWKEILSLDTACNAAKKIGINTDLS